MRNDRLTVPLVWCFAATPFAVNGMFVLFTAVMRIRSASLKFDVMPQSVIPLAVLSGLLFLAAITCLAFSIATSLLNQRT